MKFSGKLAGGMWMVAIALAAPAAGQIKPEIAEAARSIDEGVAEVAVYELQKLLVSLKGPDAIAAKEKLAEALIAAQRPLDALGLVDEPALHDSPTGKFLRAQALAGLNRYEEALPLYRETANNDGFSQRGAAQFGAAEMLRALDREDEAIRAYRELENDPRFGISARLREAELLIEKKDGAMAKGVLDRT
jgi:tetratricopeptide (TPR) repeat protein